MTRHSDGHKQPAPSSLLKFKEAVVKPRARRLTNKTPNNWNVITEITVLTKAAVSPIFPHKLSTTKAALAAGWLLQREDPGWWRQHGPGSYEDLTAAHQPAIKPISWPGVTPHCSENPLCHYCNPRLFSEPQLTYLLQDVTATRLMKIMVKHKAAQIKKIKNKDQATCKYI